MEDNQKTNIRALKKIINYEVETYQDEREQVQMEPEG